MIDRDDVVAASERIDDIVVHTPLERSRAFSAMTGASVSLKQESFQRTGAFKIRGATNRIRTLTPAQRAAGVVTASAGNHAQGVALAAAETDVQATVVMPETASISKVAATRSYGATVELVGADYTEAQQHAHDLADRDELTYLPAFDDDAVMAGQGTIALEIIADLPEVETVVVPIGGGGLIGGIAAALAESDVRVVGVQADGAASVVKSLEQGEIFERDGVDTIADGIATRRVGDRPFAIIQEHVDEVVTVADDEIAIAIAHLLERAKMLVEPAGAAGLAALLAGRVSYDSGEEVVPVLSGGNVDLNVLTTLILRGLIETGRYLKLRTVLQDQPGALEGLTTVIAEQGANIYAISHDRTSRDVAMSAAEVELELETRGQEHTNELIAALETAGYPVEVRA